ncbi:MAG TPA: metallophosphoesterase [Clostridia bacterium]|nr:metallophosphoesterase [Clostridia bacterium]
MKLFALSDLHLGQSVDKPMEVFGSRWDNHVERMIHNWTTQVGVGDCVLVGGDISWATTLEQALPDLELIDRLPGTKVLLRGNHDYWWTTMSKMEQFCQAKGLSTLRFLRHDAMTQAGFYICGTRGWLLPTDEAFDARDVKILNREMIRLGLSLEALEKLRGLHGLKLPTLALMHYPPISEKGIPSVLSDQLERARIELCVFGHIHHHSPYYKSSPRVGSVRYIMTASDQLEFSPLLIGEDGRLCVLPDESASDENVEKN